MSSENELRKLIMIEVDKLNDKLLKEEFEMFTIGIINNTLYEIAQDRNILITLRNDYYNLVPSIFDMLYDNNKLDNKLLSVYHTKEKNILLDNITKCIQKMLIEKNICSLSDKTMQILIDNCMQSFNMIETL